MSINDPWDCSLLLNVRHTSCPTTLLAMAILALVTVGTNASVSDELTGPETTSLEEAIFGGKVDLNLRARFEIADQLGKRPSKAFTERIRLGNGVKS